MEAYRRSEEEEIFEQLCVSVDADEEHEQEAIEYFETHIGQEGFDAAQWLDVALYFSLAVARGVVDLVSDEDKALSNIGEIIASNLDISYSAEECQHFAEVLQFAQTNGIPVDLELVLDGCQQALDDMDDWADEDDKAPLIQLKQEVERLNAE